jgi:predicted transcriptional regulator
LKLELLEVIERVASKIAPGRAPSFNEAQVVKALEIIGVYGTVGRIRLSKELELGEGATRTLLKHLKKEGLIEGSRRGVTFSKQGNKLFSNLRSKISEGTDIPNSPITVGPFNIAVLVRDTAHRVKRGVEQRDTAIKAGAIGATTLIFSHNKLTMPSNEEEAFKDLSPIDNILASKLNPKENDVIIVGSGENKRIAEIGAKMAALKLLKSYNEKKVKKRKLVSF